MKYTHAVLLSSFSVIAFLTTGCGVDGAKTAVGKVASPVTDGAKSVGSFLTKPFRSSETTDDISYRASGGNMAGRTSSDDYSAVETGLVGGSTTKTAYRSRSKTRAETHPVAEVAGSNYNDPGKADTEFIGNALDEEYRTLEARGKIEFDRMKKYEEKLQELANLRNEYEQRHGTTQRRIEVLRRIRTLMDSNPEMLKTLSENPLPLKSNKPVPGSALDNDILGMQGNAPSAWTPSGNAPATNQNNVMMPPISMDSAGADVFAAPYKSGRTATASNILQKRTKPNATDDGEKGVHASVLAMDGTGADATLILGAGSREGIERGMIFAAGKGSDRTVLVITKVYPTYACAMPHPKFTAREVHVRDRVIQLPALPEK